MKNVDKNKPIHTMPKGIWESSRPASNKEKPSTATESTDLQGNGYPKKESR